MPLRLTNTLTRRLEPFEPLVPGRVSIYCCGITVYDLCHLGHARTYIVWDVLRRYLMWRGYTVTYVQNVTDIDDKILQRAAREGRTMEEVSESNLRLALEDLGRLNILPPDRMPRATRCLDGIRALISELQAKGMAYSADGDVYFSVLGYPAYGKLSGRDLKQQAEGASGRVSAAEEARKRHPFDFALWKAAKPQEPSFPSTWGPGRPGWHIECSAMVREELGETIDLHLGGADLIFPHHENEIAQSEAVTGKALARYWLHNGMVNVAGEKMSKSLGNFTTIRALLDSGVSPMTLRLFVLQAHYRKPLDFAPAALEAAATGWKGLDAALSLGTHHGEALGWGPPPPLPAAAHNAVDSADLELADPELAACRARFIGAMDDDLNTAAALGELFDLARPLRALANQLQIEEAPTPTQRQLEPRWRLLLELAGVLGLVPEADTDSPAAADGLSAEAIEALVERRKVAKAARDFPEADRIRAELRQRGIELVDKPGGVTVWIRE
ncbi:MAG: cysteine--tRNA ligase [Cyanobacteriota bacterium]|nr:cysteine--tRNA ligase [Cyanobacteriota bacterium]